MKKEVDQYVSTWERRCYKGGIPDDVPKEIFDKVPSYKRVAIAIMKNDISLLGFDRPISRAYVEIKRNEIANRPGYVKSNQLKINF